MGTHTEKEVAICTQRSLQHVYSIGDISTGCPRPKDNLSEENSGGRSKQGNKVE